MLFGAVAQSARRSAAPVSLRPAMPADADDIVELTVAAGDGLPLALWQRLADPGETAHGVGRRRAQRTTGGYSYTRAEMALIDGVVVGGIIDYALGDTPEPIDVGTPPLIRPLCELENQVCGSWYVNILAVKPAFRRLGIGRLLLEEAEQRGRDRGRDRMSIIVSDANQPAQTLYAALGYRETARRRMSKQGWDGPGTFWQLLVKSL